MIQKVFTMDPSERIPRISFPFCCLTFCWELLTKSNYLIIYDIDQ